MLPKVLVHHDVQQVIDFPPNGADPLPPLSPQMPQQLEQQQSIGSIIQPPPLTEEKFMDLFMLFSHATGLRLNEQDFKIEGYQVNPWDLHRTVFARNGYDLVTGNDEWPVVGAALGFPTLLSDSMGNHNDGQLLVCSPSVALRLQELYQATLCHFDQAYISSTQARSLQTSGQAPPQPLQQQQAELLEPAEADLETLLPDVLSEASSLTSEVIRLQPQFSGTPGPELGIGCTPQHVVASVGQNGDHLQRSAGGPNACYADLGIQPENAPPVNMAWLSQASGGQGVSAPYVQSIPNYRQQLLPQQLLRAQVLQGAMAQQQGYQRTTLAPPHHIQVLPEQDFPQQMGNRNNHPLQLVVQLQDPSHARQFSLLLPQGQRQHNGPPGFASHMGQNLNHSGLGYLQGQASLQQSFVQNSLSVAPADPQFSSMPSKSQVHPPPGQQVPVPYSLTNLSLQQLRSIYAHMIRTWVEGEKGIQASSTSGGQGDIQRQQQLRLKLDTYKQRALALQELINTKARATGDLSQLVDSTPWLGQAQWPAGLYPAPERSGQYISHSLQQASADQVTQRDVPILQQSPVATAQSNLTQNSSHLPANYLPQRPQAIQPRYIPLLPEDRFKRLFMHFTAATGLRLTERDLVIEGRPVNPWVLHRAVIMRNGFESVCTKGEWPIIGVALGFPVFSGGDDSQPARSAPAVARRLQQLYNDILRQFDQAYISSIVHHMEAPSQMTPRPYQPTDADYQALLTSISPESPIMTPETMRILPRFSDACIAELAANRVPQDIIAFVEQNRGHLKRAAQDQIGYLAGLTTTKNTTFDNRAQVNHGSALPTVARPLSGYQEYQSLQRQTMVQETTIFPHVQSSIARLMDVSNVPLRDAQINTSSGEAQNQGGVMSEPINPEGVNSVTSGPVIYHSAGPIQIRKPTPEQVIVAKRWVDEQKKIAFSREFDGVADNPEPTASESEIQEYRRNLERLDQVLSNIEKYIHIAFAALKKEDVVERMFFMMASTRAQLEELKKPNPRYVLELHNIRGMIQEADNMDKGLKIVLGFRLPTPLLPVPSGRIPSVPQPPLRPDYMGIPRPIAQPTIPAAVQGDGSIPSPEEAMSDEEGLFDEEVRIAMDKLRI